MNDKPQTAESAASPATAPTSTGTPAPGLAAALAEPSTLSTQSNEWEIAAETLGANKDIVVETTEPLYDGQTQKRAVIKSAEKQSADGDGHGEAVRLTFEMQSEMTTTDGVRKAPPFRISPFPYTLVADKPENSRRAEMGRKEVGLLCEVLGLMPKGGGRPLPELYRAIGKLPGMEVDIDFNTAPSKKKDANGNFKQFQNLAFFKPGAGGAVGGAPAKAVEGDY